MPTVDERIKSLLACPIDWAAVSGVPDLQPRWLLLDWYACLMEVAVSLDEEAVINDMAEFGGLVISDENDEDTVKNIEWRMPEVRRLYAERSERLSYLEFLPPSHDGKHFKPGLSKDEVVRKTQSGPSLFFEDHPAAELKKAFWIWFDGFFWTSMSLGDFMKLASEEHPEYLFDLWKRFGGNHQLRIAMNMRTEIGGSDGGVTSRICFDLHLDARKVHAYPVSEEDAADIMKDSWVRGDTVLS
jgi:hypothetical protein